MSKEVLFKAISNKGNWIYGFYYCHKGLDEHFILPIDETPFYNGIPIIPKAISDYKVYKETVSKFTGLTDKNGTKIFEGDIVLTQEYSTRPFAKNAKRKRLIGVVEYYEQKHYGKNVIYNNGYRVKIKNQGKYVCGAWSDFYDCEVIGNIYDNPELLEDL